jgi:hypothetical protein
VIWLWDSHKVTLVWKARMADRHSISPQSSDELKRIAVRLLEIADRCEVPPMHYQLMQLADELAKIIGEIEG